MSLRKLTVFADRTAGGLRLAAELGKHRGRPDTIVIGLPRGGVVTAAPVAEALDLPLDVLVVRKLSVPHQEELAMGAIAAGVAVLNDSIIRSIGIEREEVDAEIGREREEVTRREHLFRGDLPPIVFKDRTVILVDDGLATGSTMAAAVAVIRKQGAARIVIAVPVAAPESITRLRRSVDEIVCLEAPQAFYAVGQWYADFAQVEEDEVVKLLQQARGRKAA